ncbi:unnamed protein product [Miscanthus lutarioriparius]|uniref:Uncharacterized protein n=1 Tax=Miscanthus lutarioriparius TaxID=422564 RepID=A0A811N6Z4_9POAL|nr:unnamed protein product [Miscanthus lutarioriparius]
MARALANGGAAAAAGCAWPWLVVLAIALFSVFGVAVFLCGHRSDRPRPRYGSGADAGGAVTAAAAASALHGGAGGGCGGGGHGGAGGGCGGGGHGGC